MTQLTHRLTFSSGAIAFLLLLLSLPSSVRAESDDLFIKQVKTKLSYFEKLLNSNSAEKLLAADQGAALSKARLLLLEAQQALEADDPERADALVKQGFSNFTNAVKKIAKKRKKETAAIESKKERYLKLHKTVSDLYLRLNAMNKNTGLNQQTALDAIARNLSNAEQYAAKGDHHRALEELISAQNTISTVLPKTRNSSAEKPRQVTPSPKPKEVVVQKAVPKPTPPITKKVAAPPPTEKRVAKVDTRTTLQKYSAELRTFQHYEALIQPTLERADIADHEGMQLLKTADETRLKADRARGRAIDGNYSSALKLMKEASRELKQALVRAGAKP